MNPIDERIQEIRDRINNSSTSPWEWVDISPVEKLLIERDGEVVLNCTDYSVEHDLEFIEKSRVDLEWAIDQLDMAREALRGIVDKLRNEEIEGSMKFADMILRKGYFVV